MSRPYLRPGKRSDSLIHERVRAGTDVKDKLRTAFDAAKVRAEIEVFPHARHGFCVSDSKAFNQTDAERAWRKLIALYKTSL